MNLQKNHLSRKTSITLVTLTSLLLFISSSNAASDVTKNLEKTNPDSINDHGQSIFIKYGIDESLIKLGLSSLTAGEHLVEHSTRTIKTGDKVRTSRIFLVKETDPNGDIDLRIKYKKSDFNDRVNAVDEIERNTRTEYRLRDYAQSFDPNTVRELKQDDDTVIVKFNYSKYGLPQDIAYFRHLQVAIKVKDNLPINMIIKNSKPFNYEGYRIESYEQTIQFNRLDNGRVILSQKDIKITGNSANEPLEINISTIPVALYDDADGVVILHQELLSEVSDPRIQEERVKLDRLFPLMGDVVRQKGIDMPLPYGLSISYRNQEMDVPFDNFNIMGITLNEIFDPTQSFGVVNAESISLRGDINILPFWNVFGVIGKVSIDANVDAQYTGKAGEMIKDKLNEKLPGLGFVFCKELVPAMCNPATIHVPLQLDYDVVGIGTTLSVGYKEFLLLSQEHIPRLV
ncbi:hypothetical protein N7V09_19700 [Shewanella seohaensis]|uniref:hypothetical protein n=1 Tax=Shewanella seohaensis TaxID=755175 RepID=UPI0021C722CE|nr:hypothetical protein [Shewanella seohaensis]UXM81856.1 hypothetical protein N7V09_19700 [Shewanella seohaensis]